MRSLIAILSTLLLVACNSNVSSVSGATPEGSYVNTLGNTTVTFGPGGKFRYDNRAIGPSEGTFVMKDGVAAARTKDVGFSFKKQDDGTWIVPEVREVFIKR